MIFNRVRIVLGGTLALGCSLFCNIQEGQAQEFTVTSRKVPVVRSADQPNLPPPDLGVPVVVEIENSQGVTGQGVAKPLPSAAGEPMASVKTTAADVPAPAERTTNTVEIEEQAPPAAQAVRKMTLQECIDVAMQYQPALKAAEASYGAAYNALRGLNELPFGAGLLSHDLSVRRKQATWGLQIAMAGKTQAQWDTRYAVTRNYYSVVYARQQSDLVDRIVAKLSRAHKRAEEIVKAGGMGLNSIDVQTLYLAREKTKARGLEAAIGVQKAMAALYEAMGLPCNQPLDIVDIKLTDLDVPVLDFDTLISQALSERGEMTQAQIVAQVSNLEIEAQRRILFKASARTYATGADIHSTQIPQGLANGEYRPGAIPPEMPTSMFGPRWVRVERAKYFSARAGAVVEKTENLISLETKIAYFKWKEAADRLKIYIGNPKTKGKDNDDSLTAMSERLAKMVWDRFYEGNAKGEEYLRSVGEADKTQIEYNEAVYNHALALAALERVTAGGFRLLAPATQVATKP